jgi:glycosyltransferase involved in cell wall biosynthesis
MEWWSGCLADPSAVSIVIPALNEEDAIGDVVTQLRGEAPWKEILVIDDGSRDATGERAASAGAQVVRHPYTKGNGAAVKTGIRRAQGEFVLILDADGQHAPSDASRLARRLGEYDLVIGARSAQTQATTGRRIGNQLLNQLASYLTGRHIADLTSGFRGARREQLREFLHLLPNGFSTPTTTTLAFIKAGYNVTFEPVDARPRTGQSKIKFARDGTRFFLILLKVITIFSPLRVFVPISVASLLLGLVYGLVNFVIYGRIPNGAVIVILFAVIVFLVGLISEQISSLRFDGSSRS